MRDTTKNISGRSRLVGQLASEKKKGIVALCLIAVMVFMWVKALGKKTAASAEGALMAQEMNLKDESNSELKISFIELPEVSGRNDVLTRDFFAADGWQDFLRDREGKNLSDIEEVSVVSGDGGEETARKVAEKIILEAITLGENPQAFINDKLLTVGDKFLIRDGADTYECEVAGIEEGIVFIRCEEAEIKLKLMGASITDN